jgi:hypothetical protein
MQKGGKMILVAEMQSGGVFEALSKKRLTSNMIQHFGQRGEPAGTIKSISSIKNDGSTREFCDEVVQKIQDIVDEGVAQWIKESETNNFES